MQLRGKPLQLLTNLVNGYGSARKIDIDFEFFPRSIALLIENGFMTFDTETRNYVPTDKGRDAINRQGLTR